MLGRIKYKLLKWLLDDICIKSECGECLLYRACEIECLKNTVFFECLENDVFKQARKVWGLEEDEQCL